MTCLCHSTMKNGDIFLVSGSQDCKLRIWRLTVERRGATETSMKVGETELTEEEMRAEENTGNDDIEEYIEDGKGLSGVEGLMPSTDESTEARLLFGTHNQVVAIYLEALCLGHEDWVSSCQWLSTDSDNDAMQKETLPCLVSTSMDRYG